MCFASGSSLARRRCAFALAAFVGAIGFACHATAGTVSTSYTELDLGTTTNLSAVSEGDWVKWGNNEFGLTWSTVRQTGVTPIISSTLTPLGTPPPNTTVELSAFSGEDVLSFDWNDGDSPASGSSDTVISETIIPGQTSYPTGLGVYMTADAIGTTRILDVWVQGFNSDTLLLATMSGGGSEQIIISPTKVVTGNNYSSGVFRVEYSGIGEVLTVSVVSLPPVQPGTVAFPNAGIFAAAIVPEPSSVMLLGAGVLTMAVVAYRRRRK